MESVNLLELLDIGERIEDLRQLQAGWHDGHGIALNTEGLKWLEEAFLRYFDDVRLPLPRLFPTVEGRVQAEWSLGEWEVTLEIDLATRKGEFQAVQRLSDEPEEKVLELDEARAWQQLDAMLQRFCPEARA